MSLFPESSTQPSGRAVLLSIKPKYANLILAGTKRVELRRAWPSTDIGSMILYTSAPVQRLVGIAYISRIEERDLQGLWVLADGNGGGVTYDELMDYVQGKKTAFGVMIERVEIAQQQVDPKDFFPEFTPPQSFLYLTPNEFHGVMHAMFPSSPHALENKI